MRILVDGDSCSVKYIVLKASKKYNINVIIFASINHIMNLDDNVRINYVDSYSQAVDIEIANRANLGDIVVTNDYGLASLVLEKGCFCISNRGQIFNKNNIDSFLLNRHLSMQARKEGLRVKGSSKRNSSDDDKFRKGLIKLIKSKL